MKENLLIFTKLFLVMGILWAFEIVSHYIDSRMFSLVFGILNISRGSFMFIIFILKTSVLQGLKKLFQFKPNQYPMVSDYTSLWRSRNKRGKTSTTSCVAEFWNGWVEYCKGINVNAKSLINQNKIFISRNVFFQNFPVWLVHLHQTEPLYF